MTVLFMIFLTWMAEYDSCHRADTNRAFMRVILDRAEPLGQLPRPGKLSCLQPLPDNGDYPDISKYK